MSVPPTFPGSSLDFSTVFDTRTCDLSHRKRYQKMGNNQSSQTSSRTEHTQGQHEVEIFGSCPEAEAAESATLWNSCLKNPGHQEFIPVQDFLKNPRPWSLSNTEHAKLSGFIDLTVRIRVQGTSLDRPADDGQADFRGTSRLRLGTGFIWDIKEASPNKPCPCDKCKGQTVKKHWYFYVHTVRHVIFNTEEAKKTKVDLFYDSEIYRQCGMMKSVWGLQVNWTDSDSDFCSMTCVTCDRRLAKRIWDLHCRWCSMVDSYELSFINPNRGRYALIISHPHGKPKMITVGKALTEIEKLKDGDFCIEYQTATCPGSSGAPVFPIYPDPCYCRPASRYYRPRLVHSGTFDRPSTSPRCRVNYGHNWI